MLWETFYTGLLNTIVFDDGSRFRYAFVEQFQIYDVEWQISSTQHYSVLRIGKNTTSS